MSGEFREKVFAAVRKIPAGKVASYGDIAHAAGSPRACRAVGNILHSNPSTANAPCHRVVRADGSLAEKFGFGGRSAQAALLEAEGVLVRADGKVDMLFYRYDS